MLICNHPGGCLDASGFVSEKSARVDHRFQFRRVRIGEPLGGPVLAKERGCDDIHHFVRSLSGQNGGNQKLKGVLVIERTLRVGISRFEPLDNPRNAEKLSLSRSRTCQACRACRTFQTGTGCLFCRLSPWPACRCFLPCCHSRRSLSILLLRFPAKTSGHSPSRTSRFP